MTGVDCTSKKMPKLVKRKRNYMPFNNCVNLLFLLKGFGIYSSIYTCHSSRGDVALQKSQIPEYSFNRNVICKYRLMECLIIKDRKKKCKYRLILIGMPSNIAGLFCPCFSWKCSANQPNHVSLPCFNAKCKIQPL